MKVMFIFLFFSLPLFAETQVPLYLRGVVKEKVSVEFDDSSMKVKTNSNKNLTYRLKRTPASFEGYEQIELSSP